MSEIDRGELKGEDAEYQRGYAPTEFGYSRDV